MHAASHIQEMAGSDQGYDEDANSAASLDEGDFDKYLKVRLCLQPSGESLSHCVQQKVALSNFQDAVKWQITCGLAVDGTASASCTQVRTAQVWPIWDNIELSII